MQNRLCNIEINWGNPILVNNRFNSINFEEEIGLYLISTQYIRNGSCCERFIYVGETYNTFDKRIFQHITKSSEWSSAYGKLYIRFGKINRIPSCVDDIKHFLLTIESTIIQSIKYHSDARLTNKRQMKSWTIYYDLLIHNTGKHGIIPSELNTRDYYE